MKKPKPKVRYCRKCKKKLPKSRYFHHQACMASVRQGKHYDIHSDYRTYL